VPDDQLAHATDGTRASALVAEHRAEGVQRPARGGNGEADPLARPRVSDVERGAEERRVVAAARERGHELIARDDDQLLALGRLPEREALAGEELRLGAGGARQEPDHQRRHDGGRDLPAEEQAQPMRCADFAGNPEGAGAGRRLLRARRALRDASWGERS
jgi:hypothetical protein